MKLIIATVALVFAATMFYGITMSRYGKDSDTPKNYLATIRGKPIDQNLFMETFTRLTSAKGENISPDEILKLQYEALQETIKRSIYLDEARAKRIRVTGQDVDIAVSQIMEANKIASLDDLEQNLKKQGRTLKSLKNILKDEIKIQKLFSTALGGAALTENDFKEIDLGLIFIETKGAMPAAQRQNRKEKANGILAQLKSGGDFAVLAKKFSEDPLTSKKGGSLGYVTSGMLPKALEDAAFSLSPPSVSEIIETPQGYYILKVKDKRLRQSPDQNKDIRTYLMETKQGRAQAEWQKELDEKYKVEISNKLMLGLKAHAEGNLAEAATQLSAAQIEQPNNPYLQLILSEIYEKQGSKNLALKSMLKAAEIAPGDPKIHILTGKSYSKNKNRQSALAEFKKASILAGEDMALHEEILKLYRSMNAVSEISGEQKEINRIKKKKEFEEEMRKKGEELLPEMPLGDKTK